MGSLSNYAENALLDHVFGKSAFTMPGVWVGLSTADPTETGGSNAEPGVGAYARVSTAAADWNAASGGAIDNANAITFPTATASWGTMTHFALWDAASVGGGNMLGHAALSASKAVANGDTIRFAAGALDATLD